MDFKISISTSVLVIWFFWLRIYEDHIWRALSQWFLPLEECLNFWSTNHPCSCMGHPVSDHGDSLCDSVRGTHSVRPTPDWYLKQRDCEMRHFHVISFGGKFARALLSDPKSPAHFRIVWYFLLFFKKVDRKNWAAKNSDNYPRCVINEDLTKNSNAYLRSNLQIAIFWKTKEAVRNCNF